MDVKHYITGCVIFIIMYYVVTVDLAAVNPPCEDTIDACYLYNKTECDLYPEWFNFRCRKYCDKCTDLSNTQHVQPTSITECDDKLTEHHCMSYEDSMCYSPAYTEWATENCPFRCGYCPGKEPPCVDQTDTCSFYQKSDCEKYSSWARFTCRKYCNKCTMPTPPVTLSAPLTTNQLQIPVYTGCRDELPGNGCMNYKDSNCNGIFAPWAKANCALRCGFCRGIEPPCVDQINYCSTYTKQDCVQFGRWARYTCRKFCDKCAVPTQVDYVNNATVTTIKPTSK